MSGNVEEWVQDTYAGYSAASGDGRAVQGAAPYRVMRGASFPSTGAGKLRVDCRGINAPDYRSDHIGFRLARSGR